MTADRFIDIPQQAKVQGYVQLCPACHYKKTAKRGVRLIPIGQSCLAR